MSILTIAERTDAGLALVMDAIYIVCSLETPRHVLRQPQTWLSIVFPCRIRRQCSL